MRARISPTERERLERFSHSLDCLYEQDGEDRSFLSRLTKAAAVLFPETVCSTDEVDLATGNHRAAVSEPWPNYDEIEPILARLLPVEHPVIRYLAAGGAPEPLMIHDFLSRHAWRRTQLFNECFREPGLEYQLGIPVPVPGHVLGVGINGRRPFTEDDRFLAGLLQGHAARAHAVSIGRALQRGRSQSGEDPTPEDVARWRERWKLTPREAEVLLWIAAGKRDGEIALIFGTSPRTVHHQVESVMQKLGVETRTSAARLALELAAGRQSADLTAKLGAASAML
jgi:DNA-binding CsgD family transcriptional regulator